ncbi:MAG: chloride channel protein, partial [Reyranella sp.]|nr:chloride channel protein [Reyranella sp.]
MAPDDTGCLIHPSGNGGAPRGVMQHHGAILHNAAGAAEVLVNDFGIGDEEVFLSFLPLSHAYEHSGGQFLPIMVGAQIYYSEGLEKLVSNIEETKPTIMVVVPRLFEVEALPTVWQMTSDVTALTRPGTTLADVFAALFPCGSAPGAPKGQGRATLSGLGEPPTQFRYTFRSYTAVIIASAASAVGMELVGGTAPPLRLDNAEMPLSLIPAFLMLGVLLGGLGILFNRTLLFMLDWTAATFRRASFVPALAVGAAAGALAIVFPQAVGGGELIIPGSVSGNLAVTTLLVLGIVRFVGAMVSYPVGVPGGIFAPLLTIATVFGLLAAALLNMIVPLPPLAAAAFAIAAMGGLFSATIRAPLVGVVLAAELTGGYALLLPLIVTCVTANAVAQALGGRPVYELLLERTLRLSGQTMPPPRVGVSAPVGADDEPRPK